MALNFPSSPVDLQTYTDPNAVVWRYSATKNVWDKASTEPTKQFSGVKLKLDINESLTSNELAINFDDTSYDTDGYFNLALYPSRVTVNRTGYYRINILISTSNQGTGASYGFTVKKNGNITLTTDNAGPNQFIHYDETILLVSGDYIELYGYETGAVGEVTTDSYFEVERVGYSFSTTTNIANAFSGVRVTLTSEESMTSTPTGITWDSAPINVNADANGNVYWSPSSSDEIAVSTTGYYRIKGMIQSNNLGSSDSYTVTLRSAGSTLETSNFGPNDKLDIDETYYIVSGSIVDVLASNSGAVGALTTGSYLLLIRQGV